jgi:hypothetical protein
MKTLSAVTTLFAANVAFAQPAISEPWYAPKPPSDSKVATLVTTIPPLYWSIALNIVLLVLITRLWSRCKDAETRAFGRVR